MKKIRFGIVGTGMISGKFCEAVSRTDCAEVLCVYSRTEDNATAFSKEYGISEFYTDYEEMLLSDIDAVYIASPNVCHDSQAILAAKRGKHVLCEKIIAPDTERFLKMRRAAEENGVVLLEAMRPDFDPAIEIIKEKLKKIGKIRQAQLEYCQYSSRYDAFKAGRVQNAFNPELENSALADIGVYPLHLAMNLFGLPSTLTGSSVMLENGFEGGGSIVLKYPEMLVTVTYSKICDSVNPSVIIGESGAVSFDKINEPSFIQVKYRYGTCEEIKPEKHTNNMIYEISAFCDMINKGVSCKPYLDITENTLRMHDEYLMKRKAL